MKVVVTTTEIQDQILTNLLTASRSLRYSEIKPYNTNNDLYNYHLKELLKKGLVEKDDSNYRLSKKGWLYVESIKPLRRLGDTADRFKLYSLAILFKKDSNNALIWNRVRNRHPFYGDKGISGASVKNGETTKSALVRRLEVQTSLIVSEDVLNHALTIRKMNFLRDGDLFSDITYFIYIISEYKGELIERSEYGENMWVTLEDAIENEHNSKTQLKSLIEFLGEINTVQINDIQPRFCEESEVLNEL
jgi:predicted transcriptional regulator